MEKIIVNNVKIAEDIFKECEEKIVKNLLKSEEDIENGRVRDAEDVFKEWKEKYGI